MRTGLTAVLALLLFSSTANAQGGCYAPSLAMYLDHPDVVAIVRGTVTSVRAVPPSLTWPRDRRQIATMAVTTVWKGDVSPRAVVYAFVGSGDVAGMVMNAEYLVIAHVLSPESRAWFGLPWTGEPVLGSNGIGCGVRPIPSLNAKFQRSSCPSIPSRPSWLRPVEVV